MADQLEILYREIGPHGSETGLAVHPELHQIDATMREHPPHLARRDRRVNRSQQCCDASDLGCGGRASEEWAKTAFSGVDEWIEGSRNTIRGSEVGLRKPDTTGPEIFRGVGAALRIKENATKAIGTKPFDKV